MRVTTDMYLSGDVDNLLRGLALAATALPPGQFRDGYEAALSAVAVSFGMTSTGSREMPCPQESSQVLTGWEDVDSGVFAWGNGS